MHTIVAQLQTVIDSNRDLPPVILNNLLKEHLQNYVLDFIYEDDRYRDLIFYGGTCLRKIYGLDRMSEDLDFEYRGDFPFNKFAQDIENHFDKKHKYPDLSIKVQTGELIKRITLKFPILYELGLSPYKNANLHIKVEVRSNVSHIYPTMVSPLSLSQFTVMLNHYDLETLFAGKILACLTRSYKKGDSDIFIKGRDFYDLLWYMSKGITPNLRLLTDTEGITSLDDVFKQLDEKVKDIKPRDLLLDLEPFFIKQGYIKSWASNFHDLYTRARVDLDYLST